MNKDEKRLMNHLIRSSRRSKRPAPFLIAILVLLAVFFARDYLAPYLPFFNKNETAQEINISDNAPDNTTLSVTFLNVGQGNCVLAQSNGHYMLIDGGDNKHSSFVVSYLTDLGITSLDYVVVSHYDADHLSGIVGVLHNFDVGTVIAPDYQADTKPYKSYVSIMDERQYQPYYPSIGDSFTLGLSSFEIVNPVSYTYDDENNNSVGLRLSDGNHSFLILGDAGTKAESDMIKTGETLDADVYMVSHHGSSGSTSEALLNAVNPSFAVISVGADNDYGHPTDKILNRLTAHKIQTLRTDQDGTIIAYSGPGFLQWNTNVDTKEIHTTN